MEKHLDKEEKEKIAKELLSQKGGNNIFNTEQNKIFNIPKLDNDLENIDNETEEKTHKGLRKLSNEDFYELGLSPESNWYELDLNLLPTRGKFLPNGTKIHIRGAKQDSLLQWSGMSNEDYDFFKREEIINQMVEKNCKVFSPNSKTSSARDISEIGDRIYILFAIRELTFPTDIEVEIECGECGEIHNIPVKKELISTYQIPETLQKWFNEDEHCFVVQATKPENIELKIYIPTIGINTWAKNYFMKRHRENKTTNEHIVRLLAFLIPDHKKLNEKFITRLEREIKTWSGVKLSVLSKFADELLETYTNNITMNCKSCSSEINAPIEFKNGIKDLFITTSILDELE